MGDEVAKLLSGLATGLADLMAFWFRRCKRPRGRGYNVKAEPAARRDGFRLADPKWQAQRLPYNCIVA